MKMGVGFASGCVRSVLTVLARKAEEVVLMKCPKCQTDMFQEYLDGELCEIYLAWICPNCWHEIKAD